MTLTAIPDVSGTPYLSSSSAFTSSSSRYMKRLSKHFNHKLDVIQIEAKAYIQFAMGFCVLEVNEQRLSLCCGAETEDELAEIRECMDVHFMRFTQDADLSLHWVVQGVGK